MADPASESTPDRRPRSRATTLFLVTAGVLSLLIAAGSGFSIATIRSFEDRLVKLPVGEGCTGTDCLPSVSPKCVREACNFLVLGSDSRKGFVPAGQPTVEGRRADTIMVVQIDGANNRTVILSIPRDLRVEIPGVGWNKINTAFEHGPNKMVQTVEKLTGLEINHYLQLNFVGFQKIVDAIGGVPVCINRPMVDTFAKLNLPRAGCYNLNGRQALAFVRARHIEGDIIPDFSRIARQQQFMRALIDKALSIGALTHLPEFIRAAEENLRMDDNLNLYSLQDLTLELGQLGQKGVSFRIVPALPQEIDGIDYVVLHPDARTLFRRIREGKRLGGIGIAAAGTPISPANITIRILDAQSDGKVDEAVDILGRAGFIVPEVTDAPPGMTSSAILWPKGMRNKMEVVLSYLPNLPVEFDDDLTRPGQITVVIGADFEGLEAG